MDPTESPIKVFAKKLTRMPVVPTAASEFSLPNWPTTITSAALKSICSTLDSIKGSANLSIFGRIAPLVMNSHVAKPVAPEKLFAEIARLCAARENQAS